MRYWSWCCLAQKSSKQLYFLKVKIWLVSLIFKASMIWPHILVLALLESLVVNPQLYLTQSWLQKSVHSVISTEIPCTIYLYAYFPIYLQYCLFHEICYKLDMIFQTQNIQSQKGFIVLGLIFYKCGEVFPIIHILYSILLFMSHCLYLSHILIINEINEWMSQIVQPSMGMGQEWKVQ